MAFLDETGLAELWAQINEKIPDVTANSYVWSKNRETVSVSDSSETKQLTNGCVLYYSDEVTSSDGKVVLKNPSSINITSTSQDLSAINGKYIMTSGNRTDSYMLTNDVVYYFVSGYGSGSYGPAITVKSVTMTVEFVEYVADKSPTAYPPAVSDGYAYQGPWLMGAEPSAKIATGSYAGTGTYGSSNPNSLTFDFAPKIVAVYAVSFGDYMNSLSIVENVNNTTGMAWIVAVNALSTSFKSYGLGKYGSSSSQVPYTKKSDDGKTITWYGYNADYQFNTSGYTYYYFAIG